MHTELEISRKNRHNCGPECINNGSRFRAGSTVATILYVYEACERNSGARGVSSRNPQKQIRTAEYVGERRGHTGFPFCF